MDATVARIVADVRSRGDAALLEYTAPLRRRCGRRRWPRSRSAPTRCATPSRRCRTTMRAALQTAAARIRAFHERQALASWSYREADGSEFGQRVTPLDRVGVYVPGGKAAYPSSVLMNVIPAHVAGVRRDRDGRPDAGRRAQSAGARGRASRRRHPRLRDRRRAGDRGARLRHGHGPCGRQDLRTRQRLCRRGQAARVRRRRHRHDRRRVRGPRHRRRAARTPTGSRWISSRRPSTTSSRRRSSSRPTPRCIDAVAASAAAADRRDAAARDHRGVARRTAARSSRCATSTRRARSRTASRRSIWSSRSPIPLACCRRFATPARSSWGITRRKRSATTARARTTCCRRAAPRAFRRRSASTISRSARACSTCRSRRRARWAPWPRRWRKAKASPRTREARCTASSRD